MGLIAISALSRGKKMELKKNHSRRDIDGGPVGKELQGGTRFRESLGRVLSFRFGWG